MARRSIDAADYQHVPRPVAAMPKEFAAGHVIAPHRHPRAQLVFAERGIMHVTAAGSVWVVPPNRALWLPPGTEHSIRMATAVAMRTLYVEAGAAAALPARVATIAATPLLRELILAAAAMPVLYDAAGRDGRVVALILDEISALTTVPLHLPLPRAPHLVALAGRVLAAPAEPWRVRDLARQLRVSERHLARRFEAETGLSPAAWVRHARLVAALTLLAQGASVTAVALECGYDNSSAFSAMFRRIMGAAPSRYRREQRFTVY
jgi:AraC-like DNA-binding protein